MAAAHLRAFGRMRKAASDTTWDHVAGVVADGYMWVDVEIIHQHVAFFRCVYCWFGLL